MLFKTIVLLIACTFVAATATSLRAQDSAHMMEKVPTPHGMRPRGCVQEVPHGAFVYEHESGKLAVQHADNGPLELRDVPEYCHLPENAPQASPAQGRKRMRNHFDSALTNATTSDGPVANGWLDNMGSYPPGSFANLKSFFADYTVPNAPRNAGNAVLFYFIGSQDNDGPQHGQPVSILQPVLTWGNGLNGWSFASWACCPSNISTHTPGLQGFNSGSTLRGWFQKTGAGMWQIVSEFNGRQEVLNAQVGDAPYNWLDITLEVYNVGNCDQLASGKMTFSDIQLVDLAGQGFGPGLTWSNTGTTECNGHIGFESAPKWTAYIQHN
jgi:hypothetical protein